MTTKEVQRRVAEIRQYADDFEAAHIMEDVLHRDVLRAIARGQTENPAELAKVALRSRTIRFPRVCA